MKTLQPYRVEEPVLTAAEMRRAEAGAIAAGTAEYTLMERAGAAAAAAIAAFTMDRRALILAGPGNNGGDGYVAARILVEKGFDVTVAAMAAPGTEIAKMAAACWTGKTVTLDAIEQSAPVLVDALFGTGLTRGLSDSLVKTLQHLRKTASTVIALDFPSGIASDDGTCLSQTIHADMTIAFGAMKPSHLLLPSRGYCGRVVIADIGLGRIETGLHRIGRPSLSPLAIDTHKYRRGHVLVTGGEMAGAATLAARAAQRAGAGYVTLAGVETVPGSLVVTALDDVQAARVDAIVVGPGLGRSAEARARAETALGLGKPTVLDADIFSLFADDPERLFGKSDVMTPHEGEFVRFFGDLSGSKVDRARAAAERSGNIIVLKGADTVVAEPGGRAAINAHSSPRLATAGSGDVLAGMIAALLARKMPPFEAACAAVWLHGEAALSGREGLIAEDLIDLIRI